MIQGYKVYLNCLIPDPNLAGGKKNLLYLGALKYSISEIILHEKNMSYYIYFRISEFGCGDHGVQYHFAL